MKSNSLQFGKAMSAALFVLLLSVVGMKNALAQTQVATLQHGDDISVFYGTNAFVEAHTAAADGDIITLSSGTFTPTTINKAITLRGAGCAIDTVANSNPTIFGGTVTLNVTDTVNFLAVEGILFTNEVKYNTLNNPKFNRCNFISIKSYYYVNAYQKMNNAYFVNCVINEFNFINTTNIMLINSVIWDPSNINNNGSVILYNSIMGGIDSFENLSAYNSILINPNCCLKPQSSCVFFNCLGLDLDNSSPFGTGYTTGCVTYTSYTEVFATFRGTFDLEEPFILKDEIATGFLGSDGTQVGIYGGFMPYSNRPSYMVFKRCNVANRSTIDGKLSVDIEVVTEEE